jgi:hypothetical protein
MPTYLYQGFVKSAKEIFYKGSDDKIYKCVNSRGCYADFYGDKIFKNVHHIGRIIREVECQIEYRDKKNNIVFKIINPESKDFLNYIVENEC